MLEPAVAEAWVDLFNETELGDSAQTLEQRRIEQLRF
jgi:hypothetical protein